MARLFISDFELITIIGIHPHERERPQKLILDLEVEYDISKAARSDDISDALDYEPMLKGLVSFINEKKFMLIERLADESCRFVMEAFPVAQQVRFRVKKPGAIPAAAYAAIEVELVR
jgi:dihydroneopterin aldolase